MARRTYGKKSEKVRITQRVHHILDSEDDTNNSIHPFDKLRQGENERSVRISSYVHNSTLGSSNENIKSNLEGSLNPFKHSAQILNETSLQKQYDSGNNPNIICTEMSIGSPEIAIDKHDTNGKLKPHAFRKPRNKTIKNAPRFFSTPMKNPTTNSTIGAIISPIKQVYENNYVSQIDRALHTPDNGTSGDSKLPNAIETNSSDKEFNNVSINQANSINENSLPKSLTHKNALLSKENVGNLGETKILECYQEMIPLPNISKSSESSTNKSSDNISDKECRMDNVKSSFTVISINDSTQRFSNSSTSISKGLQLSEGSSNGSNLDSYIESASPSVEDPQEDCLVSNVSKSLQLSGNTDNPKNSSSSENCTENIQNDFEEISVGNSEGTDSINKGNGNNVSNEENYRKSSENTSINSISIESSEEGISNRISPLTTSCYIVDLSNENNGSISTPDTRKEYHNTHLQKDLDHISRLDNVKSNGICNIAPAKARFSLQVKGGKAYRRSLCRPRNSVFSPIENSTQPHKIETICEEDESDIVANTSILNCAETPNNKSDLATQLSTLTVEKCNTNAIKFNAKTLVLEKCCQSTILPFSECYPPSLLKKCAKIGEGIFGEVYRIGQAKQNSIVIKIIPIEGSELINGESQKSFDEIYSEIVIAMELSNLENSSQTNSTASFNKLNNVRCVKGVYPQQLIDLWNVYDTKFGSENDCPTIFDDDQLYITLELGHGGQDMESFQFRNAEQTYSAFWQIAASLAVAESELKFEHRDLHWGNVLISFHKMANIDYCIDGNAYKIKSKGIKCTIIDFSLSRLEYNGNIVYNDLSTDSELFLGTGDHQFEIYRQMKTNNSNQWKDFNPKSNVFWLDYILEKCISGVHYKNTKSKIHRELLLTLNELRSTLNNYNSTKEFVENEFLPL